jgi:hypothetical protein
MAALSEWLQIMLAEIARKGEDLERARVEEAQRAAEKSSSGTASNVTLLTGAKRR